MLNDLIHRAAPPESDKHRSNAVIGKAAYGPRLHFRNVFENSNALVREAVIGVWLASEGPEVAIIFEAYATLTPCMAADAEPGEFDIVLDVRQRS